MTGVRSLKTLWWWLTGSLWWVCADCNPGTDVGPYDSYRDCHREYLLHRNDPDCKRWK